MKDARAISSELSSLYRLFLRGTGASVLHHRAATSNLRKLWRHTFDDGARMEAERRHTSDAERLKVLDMRIARWNETVNNTLQMLLSAAASRGLGHKVTRNLGLLTDAYIKPPRHRKPSRVWDPQLPPESPAYTSTKLAYSKRELEKVQEEQVNAGAFRALGQVVRLAEGRSGITLGRLPVSRRR